jgi:hypothetical protein
MTGRWAWMVGRTEGPFGSAETAPRGECVVLAVHVSAHRERRVGVAEPLRNHDNGQALHVHKHAAGMSGIVQPYL